VIQAELAALLRCPETGAALSNWDGSHPEATLSTDSGRSYPVSGGIANLLPDALRGTEADDSAEVIEKRTEMAARDAQTGSYDGMLGLKLFTSVEVPLTLSFLRPEPDQLMLEGGCGTGRMTPAFVDRVRGLICVDFSRASLEVAQRKLTPRQRAKTLFIQADLSKLPLASGVFDRVGSFGVYEHIPTPAARADALAHLARACKPRAHGGRFALSAYRWGPPISWTSQKEGHHEPGHIYFIRKTLTELKNDVGVHFEVGDATERLVYYHLLWGRPKA
jgi:SAM-dependent methyltransferase